MRSAWFSSIYLTAESFRATSWAFEVVRRRATMDRILRPKVVVSDSFLLRSKFPSVEFFVEKNRRELCFSLVSFVFSPVGAAAPRRERQKTVASVKRRFIFFFVKLVRSFELEGEVPFRL